MARKNGFHIKKIVVGTDFSNVSNRAFRFSLELAKQLGSEVIAVYVKNADDLAIAMRQEMRILRRELHELPAKVNQFIDHEFQKLARNVDKDVPVRFMVLAGKPWEQILKLAKKEKADLIVTGTRSRSAVSSLVLGSTARDLIANSMCPVITVNRKSR